MQPLPTEAIHDYILLGLTLPTKMMLPSEQVGLRVAALIDLAEPTITQERVLEGICRRTLNLSLEETVHFFSYPWPSDPETDPELSSISSEAGDDQRIERDGGRERRGHHGTSPDRTDPVLALFTTTKGQHGLKMGWKFNPHDDDPYPSVPHGHGYPKPYSRTLDPYHGFIYARRDRVINRESRSAIRALWSNDQWRESARKSILYMLDHDVTFASRVMSDRNIANPMRLPRVH